MAKLGRPVRVQPVFYAVRIAGWNWDWSFGVNDMPRLGAQAYNDFRHLDVNGTLIRPKRFLDRDVEITFVPCSGLEDIQRSNLKKDSISSLDFGRRGTANAVISMPETALGPLLTVLAANRLHYLVLEGRAAVRGSAEIRRFSFRDTFDPEDLPPDK